MQIVNGIDEFMAEVIDQNHSSEHSQTKTWRMPDTLILIFFVGVFAALLTYLVPVGNFASEQVIYVVDGVEKVRTVIDPD